MENSHTQSTKTETIIWRGIRIEVLHVSNYFEGMDHIEIHAEGKTPVSITETGYKSHFFPTGGLGEFETAVDYVRAWLDHEAKSQAWKAREFSSRQLSLF